jgi:hypothetical protein
MQKDVLEQQQDVIAPTTDKLAGRVAFVIGGTHGIGAAIARTASVGGPRGETFRRCIC